MTQPGYTVKVSARAKHVRLKVSLSDASLIVVVPRGFDRKHLPEVLAEKQSWIARARRRVIEQRAKIGEPPSSRPERADLRALGEVWRVEYIPEPRPAVAIRENGDHTLSLRGVVAEEDLCRHHLRGWVRWKAKAHLVPWLIALSEQHGLPIAKAAVRAQRTRWASCSARKAVSLNQKMLFLPSHLVEYVMIHELCHTVHLDHSKHFWGLVHEHSPQCMRFDFELRTAWRYVPAWMDPNAAPGHASAGAPPMGLGS